MGITEEIKHPGHLLFAGSSNIYKFMTLSPKDYYLISSNIAMKLVRYVPYLFYLLKAVLSRVNHFRFGFDSLYFKCTGRTSRKLDVSPDIDPIEISRILNQLP